MENDEFLTIHEAARLAGKSTQTIRRMIKRGNLAAQRVKTPQGFHYVVSKSDLNLGENGDVSMKKIPTESPEKMLHKSYVENPDERFIKEANDILINQTKMLINQHSVDPVEKRVNATIDKNDDKAALNEVLKHHHMEKMKLLEVLSRLQAELESERRKPRTLFAYFLDWLLG